MRCARREPFALALLLAASCASPLVKPAAFDPAVLAESPLPGAHLHEELDGEEIVLEESADWMRLRPGHLTFVGYRTRALERTYCLVLECVPERDRLTLLPLAQGETSLSVLADPERRAQLGDVLRRYAEDRALPPDVELVSVALREAVEQQQLGPPIPDPHRVLAVVANCPSHLVHDLASDPASIPLIAKTPPRIFLKHPPQAPPGIDVPSDLPFRGVIGPFDSIVYAERTWLPKDESGVSNSVPTALDYEVELGAVIGRTLTWDDVRDASDAQIFASIAGYVLVSDVKARNPQVYERALTRAESPDQWAKPYMTGDADVDLVLGNWTPDTVAWWGYAASLGDFTALGPYFVANEDPSAVPPTALLCARSYAPNESRRYAIPGGRSAGRLYLRQCSRATEAEGAPDAMLWHVPQIVRAALDPAGALAPTREASELQPGDVIALGTPGGITLTVSGRAFYRFLGTVLFWWNALDWHDAFFGKDVASYLHHGDRLFLWGEGLGCQELAIRQITWPPPPGLEPSPGDPATRPGEDQPQPDVTGAR